MGEGGQGPGADPGQELGERRVAGQVRPDHEGVDEEPDQPFDLGPVAACDRGADDHVLLAAVAGQQDHVRAEQGHEHRRPGGTRESPQPVGHRGRNREVDDRAFAGAHPRPCAVEGQLQDGGAVQRRPPVVELVVQDPAGQPLPLPSRVVGILHRQIREIGAGVERGQLTADDPGRPFVADDVVHRQHHQVLVRCEADDRSAQQRAGRQVERRLRIRRDQPLRRAVRVGVGRHVHDRHLDLGGRRIDHLVRYAVGARDQPGAQHLVPCDERRQGPRESADVQGARPRDGHRRVVLDRVGFELGQEPHPLLRERQRQRPVAVHSYDRRGSGIGRRAVDHRGQARDCRPVEESGQWHLGSEHLAHPRGDPGGQQRVAAEREEVVEDPHPVRLEKLAPDPGEQFLGDRPGRDVAFGQLRASVIGSWQRGPVDLPVHRHRERRQLDEHRRDHVLRQAAADECAQLADLGYPGRRIARHQICHEPASAVQPVSDHDSGRDLPVAEEHGLDLGRFDPEATHLDLLIGPAQIVEPPVRTPARQVPGPVEP